MKNQELYSRHVWFRKQASSGARWIHHSQAISSLKHKSHGDCTAVQPAAPSLHLQANLPAKVAASGKVDMVYTASKCVLPTAPVSWILFLRSGQRCPHHQLETGSSSQLQCTESLLVRTLYTTVRQSESNCCQILASEAASCTSTRLLGRPQRHETPSGSISGAVIFEIAAELQKSTQQAGPPSNGCLCKCASATAQVQKEEAPVRGITVHITGSMPRMTS